MTQERTDVPRIPAGLRALQVRRATAAPFVGVFRMWQRSLLLRTVAIAVLLSSIAFVIVGMIITHVIAQGIFADRLHQVLTSSDQATSVAQGVFNQATSNDPYALGTLQINAINSAKLVATGSSGYLMDRAPSNGDSLVQLQDSRSSELVDVLVRPELRGVVGKPGAGQHWQSVGIPIGDGTVHPGIVVGSNITVPYAGQYELYLVYDIEDVQSTLDFVQQALVLGGIALVLLVGGVTVFVVRLVLVPIRLAAEVSEELSAGRLERRIPERGADVVATLARSFNRMADSLQRQITQLANLSRVQQRFVSDVSHELRTPLTTIRLASDVLYTDRATFEPKDRRSAELLRTQVERFEALLADLLEISRMDAQAADVAGEPTSLVQLAREQIDALGGLAAEMETEIRLVAPGGHVEIEVDARRITRIVRNLLANAIEHGEGRPIVVTVDSSQSAVALGVRDHGIGMRPADAARVFDRFWRADPSRQRRIGGTGLGLSISMEDAQLHGGTLEVWSESGDGTNFVLTLPRDAGAPMGPSPVQLRPTDIVVDDEGATGRSKGRPRRWRAVARR